MTEVDCSEVLQVKEPQGLQTTTGITDRDMRRIFPQSIQTKIILLAFDCRSLASGTKKAYISVVLGHVICGNLWKFATITLGN